MNEFKFNLLKKLGRTINSKKFNVTLNMRDYATSDASTDNRGVIPVTEVKNECGTSCCFLGHLPLVAETEEEINFVKSYYHSWTELSTELFNHYRFNSPYFYHELFVFSSDWPNNADQCAARMFQLLAHGLPWGFNTDNCAYRHRHMTWDVPEDQDWEKLTWENSHFYKSIDC